MLRTMMNELRRWKFRAQIYRGTFRSPEPDYDVLASLVKPGDIVVDVGANVGHYTRKLSELVGPTGRVIAFEPIPETFSLLTANLSDRTNVTLINACASDANGIANMSIPTYSHTKRPNYYQAAVDLSGNSTDALGVLCTPIDSLCLDRVTYMKIDAESHEPQVLRGATETIRRCRPAITIESDAYLLEHEGYVLERVPGSPNMLARAVSTAD